MKEYLIFSIFLYLTKNRQTTAAQIAQEFEISKRSVYRYIDALSIIGFPVTTIAGKGGGIKVVGDFYIDKFALSSHDKGVIKEFLLVKNIPMELRRILQILVK